MIMKMWNYSIVATKFNITFPAKKKKNSYQTDKWPHVNINYQLLEAKSEFKFLKYELNFRIIQTLDAL